ncbi:Ribonuclease E [Streptomyces microflavus]
MEARTSGLAERLTASVWEMRLDGVEPDEARKAVDAFNAAESVEVQRKAKNGIRTFDARSAVADLQALDQPADRPGDKPCAILLVVRHAAPAVRPDDVLSGLRAVADLAPPVPAAVTRLAQGLFDQESGTVTDPLAPDREAARPHIPRSQQPLRRRRKVQVPRKAVVVAQPSDRRREPARRRRRGARQPRWRRSRRPPRADASAAGPPPPRAARVHRQDEEPTRKGRRATRPAVAVFQAPVFAEPMFQTPETAAAAAAAAGSSSPYDEVDEVDEAEEQQTAEVQQAPAPAEAAPQGGSRRRRRRRGEAAEAEQAAEPAAPVETPAEQPAEEAPEAEADEHDGEDTDEYGDRPSRRRRRGGRRRRRGEANDTDDAEQHADEAPRALQFRGLPRRGRAGAGPGHRRGGGRRQRLPSRPVRAADRRRRRRRRRSGEGAAEADNGTDDPERTVVKVREPRKKEEREPGTGFDEVQSIKGSTRMEAKKQRRREGREQGRRRVPIITEAEFLARREAVERVMVVRQSGERTQIGVLEDNVLVEHYVNKEQATSYVGNVYLGKVQNVLPSMEAAFVDIGKGRNAVLYAGEDQLEALGMAHGPRRIETALKSGQSVLVQVTKDPIAVARSDTFGAGHGLCFRTDAGPG